MSLIIRDFLRKSLNSVVLSKLNYSQFAYKDFAYDNGTDSGTLTNRFVKHIALSNIGSTSLTKYEIKYPQFYPCNNLDHFTSEIRKIKINQIPKLIFFTYTYKTNADVNKFVGVINEIDRECMARLNEMELDDILAVLYSFMYTIPNKITKLDFYRHGIQQCLKLFNENSTKNQFVQVCFYLGLWKKNRISTDLMRTFMEENLNKFIDELSSTDFAIVSNSAFRTSTLIDVPEFSKKLESHIIEMKDISIPMLVTFIKSARHNRIRSPEINEKIRNLILNSEIPSIELTGFVHLFAYFADARTKDDELIKFLAKECMKSIRKESENLENHEKISTPIRPKDLSLLLWSASQLNCNCIDEHDAEILLNLIFSKIDKLEYRWSIDELIDSTLSLWTMNYKSSELVEQIMGLPEFNRPTNPEKIKIDSRKKLLLACFEIEGSSKITKKSFEESFGAARFLTDKRIELKRVFNILMELKEEFGIKQILYVTQVKHLNMAGILVDFGDSKLNFEIFDKTNTLEDLSTPTGLFQMKMRLLNKAGSNVAEVRMKKNY